MIKENQNYFKVVCKCGHVGRQHYVPIQFAVVAENGKEAAKIARKFPRVKHDHKDAILKVEKIDYDQYLEIKTLNNNDQYLRCHSRSEQNALCDLTDRLMKDNHNEKIIYKKENRLDKVAYKLKKYKEIASRNWEVEVYEYCY